MTNLIFSSLILLFSNSGRGGTCEPERRTIAALEAEVADYEDMTATLDQLFVDFYISTDPTGGASGVDCGTKPPGLETHICECMADSGGQTLTKCIDSKSGGGGV